MLHSNSVRPFTATEVGRDLSSRLCETNFATPPAVLRVTHPGTNRSRRPTAHANLDEDVPLHVFVDLEVHGRVGVPHPAVAAGTGVTAADTAAVLVARLEAFCS